MYVLSWQPVRVALDGSTVQWIDTFDRYQLEQSCGAGLQLNVTLGTAFALAAPNSNTSPHTATRAARRAAGPSRP